MSKQKVFDENQIRFTDIKNQKLNNNEKEYAVIANIFLKNNSNSEELEYLVIAKNENDAEVKIFEKFIKELLNNDNDFIYGNNNGVRKSEIATFDIFFVDDIDKKEENEDY